MYLLKSDQINNFKPMQKTHPDCKITQKDKAKEEKRVVLTRGMGSRRRHLQQMWKKTRNASLSNCTQCQYCCLPLFPSCICGS
jgi:hypothetical protein